MKSPPAPRHIFYLISVSGLLGFFVLSFFWGYDSFEWLVMEGNGVWQFTDYLRHIWYVAVPRNVYEVAVDANGCFPPLAYMIYSFLWSLHAFPGAELIDFFRLQIMPYTLTVMLMFTLVCVLVLHWAIEAVGRVRSRAEDRLQTLLILFSVPAFAGALERGNLTLLVVALLLWAWALRDSPVRWHREVALVLIALAAGLKVYPAVMGVLYLKEKRFGDAGRLIGYGLVAFFAPFAAFGGFHGFLLWLGNVEHTMNMAQEGRYQFIQGVGVSLLTLLRGEAPAFLVAGLSLFFSCLMLLLAFRSRSTFRTLVFLVAIMIFTPNNAYRYTLLYFSLPLVFFLRDETARTDWSPRAYVNAVFLGLLFTIPVWWAIPARLGLGFSTEIMTHLEIYLYAVAYTFLFIQCGFEAFDCLKNAKKTPIP